MEEACTIIEDVVNEQMLKRRRYAYEWPLDETRRWRANVAASNCYTGSKEGVGFHSDAYVPPHPPHIINFTKIDVRLTYLGPYPTIASLSLGTTRTFRLREVLPDVEKGERQPQTFNIELPHNSLIIMHATCQEKFKHTIPQQSTIDAFKPPEAFPPPPPPPPPAVEMGMEVEMMDPYTSRINITFRFYRPDFRPDSIPKCYCGIPAILRPAMKKRERERHTKDGGEEGEEELMKYFWMCFAGAQNEGKGCRFYQQLDMEKEGRMCSLKSSASS